MVVQRGLNKGVALFIISQAFFFSLLLCVCFKCALTLTVELTVHLVSEESPIHLILHILDNAILVRPSYFDSLYVMDTLRTINDELKNLLLADIGSLDTENEFFEITSQLALVCLYYLLSVINSI